MKERESQFTVMLYTLSCPDHGTLRVGYMRETMQTTLEEHLGCGAKIKGKNMSTHEADAIFDEYNPNAKEIMETQMRNRGNRKYNRGRK